MNKVGIKYNVWVNGVGLGLYVAEFFYPHQGWWVKGIFVGENVNGEVI